MKKRMFLLTVFCVGVFFGAVSTSSSAAEPESVSGNSYLVTVNSSFGTTFSDCFVFNADGSFFSTAGLSGTWSETNLGPISIWRADTTTGGVNIDWKGIQLWKLLAGRGQSDQDTSFTAVGPENNCAAGMMLEDEDPYLNE